MLRLSIEMAAAPARSRLPLGVVFSGFLSVWLATASSAGTKVHLQAGGEQPVSRLLRTIMRRGMAGDCAALSPCSGERQRRGVYLRTDGDIVPRRLKSTLSLLSKNHGVWRHRALYILTHVRRASSS